MVCAPGAVGVRKESSTTTFWAGVFEETRTLVSEMGRLRRQFFKGARETTAGVEGGGGFRNAPGDMSVCRLWGGVLDN